jgi:hypothetical protein
MTSCGPYSEATVLYDPNLQRATLVSTPHTVLNVVETSFPDTMNLIERAGLTRLYNSCIDEYEITLFVDKKYKYTDIQKQLAYQLCKRCTIGKKIDVDALRSSKLMIIKTLSQMNNIIATIDGESIYVNGCKILGLVTCLNGIIYITDGSMFAEQV